jgi:hypothetical protein
LPWPRAASEADGTTGRRRADEPVRLTGTTGVTSWSCRPEWSLGHPQGGRGSSENRGGHVVRHDQPQRGAGERARGSRRAGRGSWRAAQTVQGWG